jgi:hypothetical protein
MQVWFGEGNQKALGQGGDENQNCSDRVGMRITLHETGGIEWGIGINVMKRCKISM